MYITRFTTVTNKTENYYYQSVEDAENHLALFLNDNSGLYIAIYVFMMKTKIRSSIFFLSGMGCRRNILQTAAL